MHSSTAHLSTAQHVAAYPSHTRTRCCISLRQKRATAGAVCTRIRFRSSTFCNVAMKAMGTVQNTIRPEVRAPARIW
eukprot:746570-Rhodomonas_salina.3